MKNLPMRRPAARSVRGIVMLEVLVALLIFMLGVLGLVGLQGAMTRAQTESKFRSDASFLATEAIGRMWSDVSNLASFADSSCNSLPRCKEWQTKVKTTLPQGNGVVTMGTNPGDATVTITWTPPGGTTHTYATSTTVAK